METVLSGLGAFTVEELNAIMKAAEKLRFEKLDAARLQLRAEMEQKAAALDISLEDLLKVSGSRHHSGGKVAVKYRGPHGEEWSGRGKVPTWLAALEAAGRNREEFRV